MNYFELYGLPVSFTPDPEMVQARYFELQKKYHPDFYTQESEAEQAGVLERSSQVNKAWQVFRDPARTMQYVLGLKGLLEEEEKYPLPPGFLMEVMELNEEISESTAAEVDKMEKTLYSEVQPLVENYDEHTSSKEDLLKVKEFYFKKKYLDRIRERLNG